MCRQFWLISSSPNRSSPRWLCSRVSMRSSRLPISTFMPPALAGGGLRATNSTSSRQVSSTARRPAPDLDGFPAGTEVRRAQEGLGLRRRIKEGEGAALVYGDHERRRARRGLLEEEHVGRPYLVSGHSFRRASGPS